MESVEAVEVNVLIRRGYYSFCSGLIFEDVEGEVFRTGDLQNYGIYVNGLLCTCRGDLTEALRFCFFLKYFDDNNPNKFKLTVDFGEPKSFSDR